MQNFIEIHQRNPELLSSGGFRPPRLDRGIERPRLDRVEDYGEGGGHFDSPANSQTKEARTMKLCTLIVYYITSITKQLKFLNAHCCIVCSYCPVVCLIAKMC